MATPVALISRFKLEVQETKFGNPWFLPYPSYLPQSGSGSQPRVAASATLGNQVRKSVNRNAVVSCSQFT